MTGLKLEWRPIDAAAKDQPKDVLLSDGDRVSSAQWQYWGSKEGEGFWRACDTEVKFEPIYWTSIPELPKNQPQGPNVDVMWWSSILIGAVAFFALGNLFRKFRTEREGAQR